MVFRVSNLKENLLWKIVKYETNLEYKLGIQELVNDGFKVLGIVADGRQGLKKLFPNIPFQLCQFHQFQTVTKYISKNPKLEASKELRKIMMKLKDISYHSFGFLIDQWYKKWKEFLVEKTIDPISKKSSFTHQRLRQAFFSIRRNLPYLFTFEFYSKEIKIPNTTNSLDRYFNHLKSKINIHQGSSRETQIRLISELIFKK